MTIRRKIIRKIIVWRNFLIAAFTLFIGTAHAQDFENVEIKTIPVAKGIYMLIGSGGNIGVSVGEDGVFLVDDQFAPLNKKITDAVAKISDAPIRFVLNTHWHADHTGGNELMGEAGVLIVAHDNVRKRLSSEQFMEFFNRTVPPSPQDALPVVTFNDTVTFHLNCEETYAFHVAPAHTDGDSVVFFRNANVIHMGDTYFAGRFPFIDLSSGGGINGVIAAIDRVLEMTNEETKIIPGHGPLSNPRQLRDYKNMLVTMRDRITKQINSGKTMEEVLAAKPTAGFEDYQGDMERFVRILYGELSRTGGGGSRSQ